MNVLHLNNYRFAFRYKKKTIKLSHTIVYGVHIKPYPIHIC